jgi:hypothetical protein
VPRHRQPVFWLIQNPPDWLPFKSALTCLTEALTLVTDNRKDFAMPGLTLHPDRGREEFEEVFAGFLAGAGDDGGHGKRPRRNGQERGGYQLSCHARAYGSVQAAAQFFAWCEEYQLQLRTIRALHVSAYIETKPLTAPSIKQHLAALRGLFNWLVIKQVVADNPALFVKGPKLTNHLKKIGSRKESNPQRNVPRATYRARTAHKYPQEPSSPR